MKDIVPCEVVKVLNVNALTQDLLALNCTLFVSKTNEYMYYGYP